ncbi:MAG: RsiV family protein, partial [Peptostreptococcaceae bacterium]
NIYMKTGEVLNLEELFNSNVDYKGVINNEIRHQIENLVKKDKENEGIYQFIGISENQQFYIQDNNIVIYFDLYEIAPYAAGIPEFRINASMISHILKDQYIDIFK